VELNPDWTDISVPFDHDGRMLVNILPPILCVALQCSQEHGSDFTFVDAGGGQAFVKR